jgi:hypothetical protein
MISLWANEAFRPRFPPFCTERRIQPRQKNRDRLGETKMKNPSLYQTIQRFQKDSRNAIGYQIALATLLGILVVLAASPVLAQVSSAPSSPLTTAAISPRQHAPMRLHRLVPGGAESETGAATL